MRVVMRSIFLMSSQIVGPTFGEFGMKMTFLSVFVMAALVLAGPIACKKKDEAAEQPQEQQAVQDENAAQENAAQENDAKDYPADAASLIGVWALDGEKTIEAAGDEINGQEAMMMKAMKIGMRFGDGGSFATRVSMMGQGEEMTGTYEIQEATKEKVTVQLVPDQPEVDPEADEEDAPAHNLEPSNMTIRWIDANTIRVVASGDSDDTPDEDEPVMIFARVSDADYDAILKPAQGLTEEELEMIKKQQENAPDAAPAANDEAAE